MADYSEGMGFSITSNIITTLIPYLEKGIAPDRVRLGVTCIAVRDILTSDETNWEYQYKVPEGVLNGIYITDVSAGTVAEGKLMKDDIILQFDGIVVKKNMDLSLRLHEIVANSGTKVLIEILRNGEKMEIEVIF